MTNFDLEETTKRAETAVRDFESFCGANRSIIQNLYKEMEVLAGKFLEIKDLDPQTMKNFLEAYRKIMHANNGLAEGRIIDGCAMYEQKRQPDGSFKVQIIKILSQE